MRLSSFFGSTLLCVTALLGCSEADSEAAASGADAQTANESARLRLTSADYGRLKLVVKDGMVRGYHYSSVGDPRYDGAACAFAFAGPIYEADDGREASTLTVTDGFVTVTGSLNIDKEAAAGNVGPEIELVIDDLLTVSGCGRMTSGGRLSFSESRSFAANGTQRWAAVKPQESYFYDAPRGARTAAYVIAGDVVAIKGIEDDFARVEYTQHDSNGKPIGMRTAGYLRLGDLQAPDGLEVSTTE